MIVIEEIKYFIEAYFYQGIGWDLIEDAVIDHRSISKEERTKFKEEILYIKNLLDQNQFEIVNKIIVSNDFEGTKVSAIEGMQRFVNAILPLIEKFELKKEISYIPLKSLKYMIETIIIPTDTSLSYPFFSSYIQKEGDTFIQHFKQDLEYVEQAFKENDKSKIEEILQISHEKGVYIFDSEYRDSFIQEVMESLS
ncbi:hypothetical protein ACZ11_09775 [Lysinibacillus xylanilyticus]|uniref:Uncharacterized protein n=1 Tax=Lysinibacillus xylanilyticus TaxID=582475 RepID=A0A0K9FE30_9BACI|nr:hypothetical protein [Lysinibacillus xylanilyticus]KMY32406.1 hypothetical protein ACZ11_09775 [Lysinibacillus xylanilyticus]QPQ31099.1 hypothetical protein JNUCC51_01030 [Lysinibacillus sp. JNUCC-51]